MGTWACGCMCVWIVGGVETIDDMGRCWIDGGVDG